MAYTDFVPRKDETLWAWGANLNDRAGISPTDYNLSVEEGARIVTSYSRFDTAMQQLRNPGTRSPLAVIEKREARREFVKVAREMVALIQANPATTDGMRGALEITIRKEPAPVGRPTVMPLLSVRSVVGRVLNLEVRDAQTNRRRKPAGVKSVWLWSYVGETAPLDLGAYTFHGGDSRTRPELVLGDAIPPNTVVWVTAMWVNGKDETGPACEPVQTRTNYDVLTLKNAA